MPNLLVMLSTASILLCGAIFGFFYAWVCSTMSGLDQADPRVAIAAMQAMNASVRNVVFFPAFFLTPVVLALTGIALFLSRHRQTACCFMAATVIYAAFGLALTMLINVQMNEALAEVSPVPSDIDAARDIWAGYSGRWQVWNQVRTVASGLALVCAAFGLTRLQPDVEKAAN